MTKTRAVLGSLAWLLLAPGGLTLLVPWMITGWRPGPPLVDGEASRWVGVVLITLGLPVLVEAFARFALVGRGTPVPLLPTERLVVSGFYRRVRNPMYVAVIAIVVGEALWLGSPRVMAFALALWAVFHAFVFLYEEPRERRRFGAEYERYCAAVPRWIPLFSGGAAPSSPGRTASARRRTPSPPRTPPSSPPPTGSGRP